MKYFGPDRRQSGRFDTKVGVEFYVTFDIQTKIDFRVKKDAINQKVSKPYQATGKNVSVEGLCFISGKLLAPGDYLILDVFIPSAQSPIPMEGEVKWSQLCRSEAGDRQYETGVKLLTVRDEDVERSVFFDKVHNIVWSNVLEAIFGSFKTLVIKKKRQESAGDGR